jgi:hypothetical protein
MLGFKSLPAAGNVLAGIERESRPDFAAYKLKLFLQHNRQLLQALADTLWPCVQSGLRQHDSIRH